MIDGFRGFGLGHNCRNQAFYTSLRRLFAFLRVN